jgi:hypothetical protein
MSLSFTSPPRSRRRHRHNHRTSFLFLFLGIVTILFTQSHARLFTRDLISDGSNILRLPTDLPFHGEESTCEQTYGFLPCTTTVFGNLFLIIVYGFLMYTAATFLSNGSELLLEILGPGIVGGLFLPILGALPDAMLILGTNHNLFSFFYIINFTISVI